MKAFYKSLTIALLIFLLSVINFSEIDDEKISLIPHADKIVHFLMYFTLGLFLQSDLRKARIIKKYFLLGVGISILYGLLMEIIQLVFTNYRSFELADFLVNTCGVFVSFFTYKLLLKTKQTFF